MNKLGIEKVRDGAIQPSLDQHSAVMAGIKRDAMLCVPCGFELLRVNGRHNLIVASADDQNGIADFWSREVQGLDGLKSGTQALFVIPFFAKISAYIHGNRAVEQKVRQIASCQHERGCGDS